MVITVTLLVTALLTVVALVVLIWSVVRRTTALAHDLRDLQTRIGPDLERLQRDAAIVQRELEEIRGSVETLEQQRQAAREARDRTSR